MDIHFYCTLVSCIVHTSIYVCVFYHPILLSSYFVELLLTTHKMPRTNPMQSGGCHCFRLYLFSSFFCLVVVDITARCGAHFTTAITCKHSVLACFGVDPCGTAKDTVEGFGMCERCKESENEYKKGVRRICRCF